MKRMILFTCAFMALFAGRVSGAEPKPPNVIVFLMDDLGYGDLGCYGHPFMITPNFDTFAAEGMRFTDFHAGSAICSPSRAALMTGRNPFRLGIWQNSGRYSYMQDSEVTIAEALKPAGYQTFFTGKWHMGDILNEKQSNLDQPDPGQQGFDQWMVRSRIKSCFLTDQGVVPYKVGGHCDEVVETGIEMLKARDPNKPFFLHMCVREPHTPLTPPQEFMDLYDNAKVRRLEKFLKYGRVKRPAYLDENAAELARYYYGTVTQTDRAFGALMKALDEMNLREDTIVIVTSDNGCEHPVRKKNDERDRSWGTPGEFRGMKRFLYEGGQRVVGMVRWPGVVEPSVSDVTVSAYDLLPTLCGIAGAELPDCTLDGTDIRHVLEGEPFVREKPIFMNMIFLHAPNMSMHLGKYVLMGYFAPIKDGETEQDWAKRTTLQSYELYDLEADPKQEVDLKEKEVAVYLLMKKQMEEMWTDVMTGSPTWPGYKGNTRPVNEGAQMNVPGAIR